MQQSGRQTRGQSTGLTFIVSHAKADLEFRGNPFGEICTRPILVTGVKRRFVGLGPFSLSVYLRAKIPRKFLILFQIYEKHSLELIIIPYTDSYCLSERASKVAVYELTVS